MDCAGCSTILYLIRLDGSLSIDFFFLLFMEETFEIQRINCEISGLELDLKLSTIIK